MTVKDPINVLFVCTANICRSAFAHALARSMASKDQLEIRSVGTHAWEDRAMDPIMVAELANRGVSDPEYTSRRLTPEILEAADIILTMTVGHRVWILDDFPQLVRKVYTLAQFASAVEKVPDGVQGRELLAYVREHRGHASSSNDVVDPFGTGEEATAAAAAEIEGHLQTIIPRLVPATS
ncbi:hypothetical protein ACQBAT_00640 [Ornithinimicrobium sp. Y1847]|uniref:arsenate reductase/protein-tyrosine-phosphatase family protein n=1 Tax=Ornithinimicrobium sp. Y1847 TaxID=3405419 RepID=UPI003B675DAA